MIHWTYLPGCFVFVCHRVCYGTSPHSNHAGQWFFLILHSILWKTQLNNHKTFVDKIMCFIFCYYFCTLFVYTSFADSLAMVHCSQCWFLLMWLGCKKIMPKSHMVSCQSIPLGYLDKVLSTRYIPSGMNTSYDNERILIFYIL
jgi:hypothetical protein